MKCNNCQKDIPDQAVLCRFCEEPVLDATGQPKKRPYDYSLYGVGRKIPPATKQQIRAECGFGCVFDGEMFCQYDHFSPEFPYVRERHEAAGIAMLCLNCHGKRTQAIISTESVNAARKDPFALRSGNSPREQAFFVDAPLAVSFGSNEVLSCDVILSVGGERVIWLSPTDFAGAPNLLNAQFQSQNGQKLVEIDENELVIQPPQGFDVIYKSRSITFALYGNIFLKMTRSDYCLDIEEAAFWYNGRHIEVRDDWLSINGSPTMSNCKMISCVSAINVP